MAAGINLGQEQGYINPVVDASFSYELKDAVEAQKEVINHKAGSHGKLILKVAELGTK